MIFRSDYVVLRTESELPIWQLALLLIRPRLNIIVIILVQGAAISETSPVHIYDPSLGT